MAENDKTAEQSSPAPARGGRAVAKDPDPSTEAGGAETFQVAAAFHGADPDEEVTVDDAKQRVDQWLNDTQSATEE